MSAFDEVIAALQAVVDKLDDVTNAAGTAETEADDATAQAVALGATGIVAGLAVVKGGVEKVQQQVAATVDTANETISHARAVASGT